MGDLQLSGLLDLSGDLSLAADGGKVTIAGLEVLVELTPTARPAHCKSAVPAILPPPPAAPLDVGPLRQRRQQLQQDVKIGGKAIVAQGIGDAGQHADLARHGAAEHRQHRAPSPPTICRSTSPTTRR